MKKLGVVFGGMSTENKVSIVSANSVLQNLDKNKYEIYPIYIDSKENGGKQKHKKIWNLEKK